MKQALQARGEDTRKRIIEAALELFAAEGYEGTHTRQLAEKAGVNLPAIQYYFGSKEGLYAAVIEYIVTGLEEGMAETVIDIHQRLSESDVSKRDMLDMLCDLLDTFTAVIMDVSGCNGESRRRFFARAEIEEGPAKTQLQEGFRRHMLTPCARLIGDLIGRSPDDEETLINTFSIIGQAIIFCKSRSRELLGWSEIDESRMNRVQALVHSHTRAIFSHVVKDEAL